ncbi:hypothetical protein FHL06_01175 [Lactobacillus halodurans]|uniref:AP2-like integrase N-terminal domain-containing protein n=1 Tax=Companilactobacillus halodurans TaxID=2584183 RepID=A0A5P0ZLL3_9LACO|nr:Arm DNA-binding domain-containing protein [Companilactobacillus halodurans]MQS75009.1 hypothetical protein [Companilactobacillus halodurans]
MEVYKRGKAWTYRIRYKDTNGKRKSLSKSGFKTKKEAYTVGSIPHGLLSKVNVKPEPSSSILALSCSIFIILPPTFHKN